MAERFGRKGSQALISLFSRSPTSIPLRLAWDECERGDDTHPTNAEGEEGWDGGNEQIHEGCAFFWYDMRSCVKRLRGESGTITR